MQAEAGAVIGWYAHHHGRGHVNRVQTVARWMTPDPVVLSSAPRPAAWTGEWLELAGDVDRSPARDPDAGGVLHWAPLGSPGLRLRGAVIAAWVAAARPSLVVVDVSIEVTLLVRLLGVPVVVVAMQGDRGDRPHVAAYDAASVLIAPWPADAEVDGFDRWQAKTVHTGAFSRYDGRPRVRLADDPGPSGTRSRRVLLLGGFGGTTVTDADLASAAAATPGWTWVVRTGGPGAVDDVWPDLLAADVVVVHGGQNAVSEVAAARRPAVVVAQPRPHDEQVHRVRTLGKAGLCVGLESWPEPSRWSGLLEDALSIGGEGWAWWSPGDGARVAARALERVSAQVGR